MALVELSVMEQRYEAVMAVIQGGWKITEVAERLGVTIKVARSNSAKTPSIWTIGFRSGSYGDGWRSTASSDGKLLTFLSSPCGRRPWLFCCPLFVFD